MYLCLQKTSYDRAVSYVSRIFQFDDEFFSAYLVSVVLNQESEPIGCTLFDPPTIQEVPR